jgi:hypothetical protein
LDKLLEYTRNWMQHVNKMTRNRLPRIMKHYSPTGRRNHGGPLKRLLDTWDRNESTSGPTPWQIYDDDDDDEFETMRSVFTVFFISFGDSNFAEGIIFLNTRFFVYWNVNMSLLQKSPFYNISTKYNYVNTITF